MANRKASKKRQRSEFQVPTFDDISDDRLREIDQDLYGDGGRQQQAATKKETKKSPQKPQPKPVMLTKEQKLPKMTRIIPVMDLTTVELQKDDQPSKPSDVQQPIDLTIVDRKSLELVTAKSNIVETNDHKFEPFNCDRKVDHVEKQPETVEEITSDHVYYDYAAECDATRQQKLIVKAESQSTKLPEENMPLNSGPSLIGGIINSIQRQPLDAVMEKQPISCRLMLPEYCMTLEYNFHPETVNTLLAYMNSLNGDVNSPTNLLLVTGSAGSGKSFCIHRACQLGGYDCTSVDLWHEDVDTCMREAILSPPDPYAHLISGSTEKVRRIRVVVVDALDGYDAKLVGKLCKYLNSLLNGDTTAKKSKKKSGPPTTLRMHNNLIILTANARFEKSITSWMYKLKPTEVKVTPPNYPHVILLLQKSCEYLKIPMAPRVHKLLADHVSNVTSLLMKLQFLSYKDGALENDVMSTDPANMDIFVCARKLLEPSEVKFQAYDDCWECGGDKMNDIIYNSYPPYVKFIPETPVIVTKLCGQSPIDRTTADLAQAQKQLSEFYSENDTYFIGGLKSLQIISDTYSLCDVAATEEMMESVLRLTVKLELEDIFSRSAKRLNIDVKSKFIVTMPPCLNACKIGKREAESLHYVYLMHILESNKKVLDFKYESPNAYNLSEYLGFYYTKINDEKNEWLIVDLFPPAQKGLEKDEKKTRESKIHPKLEAIQLFSHKYAVETEVKKLSTARVKLSNGKMFSKNNSK